MNEKTLAFDLETLRLAREVEEEYASELTGKSPWTRPDLFGFGCGVIVDLATNVSYRYREAAPMIEYLSEAGRVVSYNGESFDLKVLEAYGDVSEIRAKHVDINALVMAALDEHPLAQKPNVDRIRQGGLDGLAKANGLGGKTAGVSGLAVPGMLREGKAEEVLNYCEVDTRLVAELYRIARQRGALHVDAFTKVDGRLVELGCLEVPVPMGEA